MSEYFTNKRFVTTILITAVVLTIITLLGFYCGR